MSVLAPLKVTERWFYLYPFLSPATLQTTTISILISCRQDRYGEGKKESAILCPSNTSLDRRQAVKRSIETGRLHPIGRITSQSRFSSLKLGGFQMKRSAMTQNYVVKFICVSNLLGSFLGIPKLSPSLETVSKVV